MPDSDGSIYKELSAEMRDGLKNIYQQISTACAAGNSAADPEALFHEASDQLREVVRETESAAMDIMEIVEKQLEQAAATASLLATLRHKLGNDPELELLRQKNSSLSHDLTSVLTALSFQDITGQRIKKVMAALSALENSVVELYLSSGLVMEAAEKDPSKAAGEIREDAARAMAEYRENKAVSSELKGPDSNGVSQAAIDDMLAQLGL